MQDVWMEVLPRDMGPEPPHGVRLAGPAGRAARVRPLDGVVELQEGAPGCVFDMRRFDEDERAQRQVPLHWPQSVDPGMSQH